MQFFVVLLEEGMSALGFFGGEDVSSSEEEDEVAEAEQQERKHYDSDDDEVDEKDKLPSPTRLLSSVQRPDFLKSADAQARRDLIAEKRAQLEQERLNASGSHTAKGMYGAVAPPVDVNLPTVLSAKPVFYEAQKSISDAIVASGEAVKRPRANDSNGGSKKKVETFRQKEKRKRDLGQTSREKSYVEEEKRLLRQSIKDGADVVGGD